MDFGFVKVKGQAAQLGDRRQRDGQTNIFSQIYYLPATRVIIRIVSVSQYI